MSSTDFHFATFRFDGRGYLTDFYEEDPNCDLSPGDHLSEEEIAIEKMCDFERYLEMQVDVHELAIQDGEFTFVFVF